MAHDTRSTFPPPSPAACAVAALPLLAALLALSPLRLWHAPQAMLNGPPPPGHRRPVTSREIARVSSWDLLLKLPPGAAFAPDCVEHNAVLALLLASGVAGPASAWYAFGRRLRKEGEGE